MPNKGGPVDRWQRSSFPEVIFISKVSALSEFIVYLPTAPDHIVSPKKKIHAVEYLRVNIMTTIEAIETEITKLSAPDLMKLRQWFMNFDSDAWDAQIEKDAASGKLDALANEALNEYRSGKVTEI